MLKALLPSWDVSLRSVRLGTVCVAAAVLISACQAPGGETQAPGGETQAPGGETNWERIQREKTIRVGFANENPWNIAMPDGTLGGVSPDIIRRVMSDYGIENVEGVLTEFSGLLPGLQAGRWDMAVTLAIRPDRCEVTSPSDPEVSYGVAFAVLSGNPKNLHSFQDVADNPDARLGVLLGSSEAEYAAINGIPEDRIVEFPDIESAIAGILAGRADAATAGFVVIHDVVKKTNDPRLAVASPFEDPVDENGEVVVNYNGTYFQKDDHELREAYNQGLRTIKENGELLGLLEPYGFTEANIPPLDLTAEDICEGSL